MRLPTAEYDAWNPGLESELPREYLPLSTVFRSENVFSSIDKTLELSEYCGLPADELIAFRPDRLIVHELLIQVTTGISVPDGRDEDLGKNFRDIAATILNRHIAPHRAQIRQAFEQVKDVATLIIKRELADAFPTPKPTRQNEAGREWRWLFGPSKPRPSSARPLKTPAERELEITAEWRKRAAVTDDPTEEACFKALDKIATAVLSRRGRLFRDIAVLTELAVTLVCNDHGSEVIGEAIVPFVRKAIAGEGYRSLPRQQEPVVMNIKGASASGKSTMRPLQRRLARKLHLPWEDFALISPDIWRKFLLDYGSLGEAYKYAGMLAGHEVEIIDKKLDQRMETRAAREEMPHLLIDRFRFDNFVPGIEGKGPSRLLTRFGDLVYMFFMITPPEMAVDRAWLRGLQLGRYKAVEDILAHNIEAYTGMPELFFTWALSARKRVHYEFLDNSVPKGRRPRTVAFGWNTELTILDIKRMIDMDRFKKIDIHAHKPEDVYIPENLPPERNVEFLKRCARWIPTINFADYRTGRVYARLDHGKWVWRDEQMFTQALEDPDSKAGLLAVAPNTVLPRDGAANVQRDLMAERTYTIGVWGKADVRPA